MVHVRICPWVIQYAIDPRCLERERFWAWRKVNVLKKIDNGKSCRAVSSKPGVRKAQVQTVVKSLHIYQLYPLATPPSHRPPLLKDHLTLKLWGGRSRGGLLYMYVILYSRCTCILKCGDKTTSQCKLPYIHLHAYSTPMYGCLHYWCSNSVKGMDIRLP